MSESIEFKEELKDIEFDELWGSDIRGFVAAYFTAPKEYLRISEKYPDAISTELSIEFDPEHPSVETAVVSASPIRETEDGGTEEFDWDEIWLPVDEVVFLLEIAVEKLKEKEREE